MDNNFANMSPDERKDAISRIVRKRRAVAKPDSLKILSIKAISLNCNKYLNRVENPLRFLPSTIVQEFIQMIKESRYTTNRLIPKDAEMSFVKLLLNENLTEFNPYDFNPYSRSTYGMYYNHILEHCPNITKIIRGRTDFHSGNEEFPMGDLLKWRNLKYFGFQNFLCGDEQLQQISEHIPKLEGMEISVTKDTITEKAVEYFSKMKHLKHLSLKTGAEDKCVDLKLIVDCVGNIPNLQTFQLNDTFEGPDMTKDFVQMYGLLFPKKKLIATNLRIRTPFEIDLPSNLLVEKLEVQGEQSALTVQKLSSMPNHPKELIFNAVPYHQVYPILKSHGPHIKDLEFLDFASDGAPLGDMNLYTVIEFCPNLEVLSYKSSDEELKESYGTKLPLKNFRNWKKFDIEDDTGGYDDGNEDDKISVVDKIFKLFVLGSENYNRTLHLKTFGQIKVLLEALKENSTCLSNLEKIKIDLYKDPMIEHAVQVAEKLIFRSPYLKKIKFHSYSMDASSTPHEIRMAHKWFNELVQGVGVYFKNVCEVKMGKDDSSFAEFTELEDSDSEGDNDLMDSEDGSSEDSFQMMIREDQLNWDTANEDGSDEDFDGFW
ncbi:uncharacterized protein LOC132193078 [Neocloeon triangulifer]|uniref:uncharacterized protein LOC132193078 n=1 Tax=Neocloeon triangulifer TaxID=2078957 RepID=UPI00286F8A5E|nr:uncharacterized protein LOC132193078 [Neocloeon triangulifer]XP_059469433.1 uncharacterized protein LOC132193078 [Neocloeon triangulifer]